MRPTLRLRFPSPFYRRRLQQLEAAKLNGQDLLPPPPINLKPRGDYIVHRTKTGNLPIYTDMKKNGMVSTLVRKVEGNQQKLRADLNDYFASRHTNPFKRFPEFVVKPITKHLEVRGVDWKKDVAAWLEKNGH